MMTSDQLSNEYKLAFDILTGTVRELPDEVKARVDALRELRRDGRTVYTLKDRLSGVRGIADRMESAIRDGLWNYARIISDEGLRCDDELDGLIEGMHGALLSLVDVTNTVRWYADEFNELFPLDQQQDANEDTDGPLLTHDISDPAVASRALVELEMRARQRLEAAQRDYDACRAECAAHLTRWREEGRQNTTETTTTAQAAQQ